jgi:hypothetical protein
MLSSGARLGDHGDDMSRSMMGSQLERGNSNSTREVAAHGCTCRQHSLKVLRHVIVVKRCTTYIGGWTSGLDRQIQQYIQDTTTTMPV